MFGDEGGALDSVGVEQWLVPLRWSGHPTFTLREVILTHACIGTCWVTLGVAMASPVKKCLNYLFILWRIVMRNAIGEKMCKYNPHTPEYKKTSVVYV